MHKIKVRWIRSRHVWGLAIPHKKTIYLDDRMDDKTMLDVASHEVIHICFPDLSEESVNEAGKTIADVLWRLGFRREED